LISNEKVTKSMIRLFDEAAPGANIFLIFSRKRVYNESFDEFNNVQFADDKAFVSTLAKKSIDKIVIHSLDFGKVDFIEQHLHYRDTAIIWILWGGEVYNRPEMGNRIYGPKTKKV